MAKELFLTLLLSWAITPIFSQTFSSSKGGPLLDNPDSITEFPIEVRSPMRDSLSHTYGLKRICINLTHPDMYQLDVWLIAPDGQSTPLLSGLFGGDFNACLDMSSGNYVTNNWGPFSGILRPVSDFGVINFSGKSSGTWKLRIRDKFAGTSGYLNSWSITLGSNPPHASPIARSSRLPVIRIQTGGTVIVDDPKRIATLELVDGPLGNLNGFKDSAVLREKIGIEIRGSSSQWFPKKSYGFEFVDSAGNEKNVSILGLPSESDWILSANFTDKSFLNNAFAYQLYQSVGRYASRTRFVELILDGEPQGLYVLMEKIKQDKNRVNIAKLTPLDTSGNDLTGGYIFKIDKSTGGNGAGWTSSFPPPVSPNNQTIYFQYHDPEGEELTEQQKRYIQNYVDRFERSLMSEPLHRRDTGWRKFADEGSFIHYFLLNEISRNTDGYRLSTFLYKDKDSKGGKLTIGPPWDYDIAFGNINYCDGEKTTGWAVDFGRVCPGDNWQLPFWWDRLLQDSLFVNAVNCEYFKLRESIWSNESLDRMIEDHLEQITESALQNFKRWAILGTYIWPNPGPLPTSFEGEVSEFKNWLFRRLSWMDQNMPGLCIISRSESSKQLRPEIILQPNPASDLLNIRVHSENPWMSKVRILSSQGKNLFHSEVNEKWNQTISLEGLTSGIYFVEITLSDRSRIIEKLVIQN